MISSSSSSSTAIASTLICVIPLPFVLGGREEGLVGDVGGGDFRLKNADIDGLGMSFSAFEAWGCILLFLTLRRRHPE